MDEHSNNFFISSHINFVFIHLLECTLKMYVSNLDLEVETKV